MIDLRGAGFYYRPEAWVFRGYDLAVERGEVLAVLGPNGRGKTTLLRSLLGLVELKEGTVEVDGQLGYVPQGRQVPFAYTVLDMVVMGRARHIGPLAAPSRHDIEAARRALRRLSIEHFAERPINRLSAGEQQLVMIARALASESEGLVLDEPTAALDLRNQGRILHVLRQLARRQGLTVVFTTHSPQHAAAVADRVLLMYGARDYRFGQAGAVMTDERLSRLYGIDVRQLSFDHRGRAVQAVIPVWNGGR